MANRVLTVELTEDDLGVILGALSVADAPRVANYLKGWLSDETVTATEAARLTHSLSQRLAHS